MCSRIWSDSGVRVRSFCQHTAPSNGQIDVQPVSHILMEYSSERYFSCVFARTASGHSVCQTSVSILYRFKCHLETQTCSLRTQDITEMLAGSFVSNTHDSAQICQMPDRTEFVSQTYSGLSISSLRFVCAHICR